MANDPRLIAVGGGGFTHGQDPELEDFVIRQSGLSSPRIGYVATANRHDPIRISRFYQRFSAIAAATSHLPEATSAEEAAEWAAGLDIIYVGGGNTCHLLDTWRESGLDAVFMAAAQRGVLLAGVSAGAAAWFDYALSDSGGSGLAPLAGLGLFAGSFCPHYSNEAQRPPAFRSHIARALLPDGIAVDDGVAVLIGSDGPRAMVAARPGAGAYVVGRRGRRAVTTPLARE